MDSTQRNGIQRKGTGWTALRGKRYKGRERGGQHSEEWDTEEGNGVMWPDERGGGGGGGRRRECGGLKGGGVKEGVKERDGG